MSPLRIQLGYQSIKEFWENDDARSVSSDIEFKWLIRLANNALASDDCHPRLLQISLKLWNTWLLQTLMIELRFQYYKIQ